MTLVEWQRRWGVSAAAMQELVALTVFDSDSGEGSEARAQSQVRLDAAAAGVLLWRNNVGAGNIVRPDDLCTKCAPKAKRIIRWGLANESPKQNKRIKSADLIGVRKRLIVASDVGSYIGQLVSREIKHPGWQWGEDPEREQAQLRWATVINDYGGDAAIVTGPGSFTQQRS